MGDERYYGKREIGGGFVFSEEALHAAEEVLVPDEIVGGGDGILVASATPVLAKLGGGRRAAVLPRSDAGGPFEGLLLGEHHLGLARRRDGEGGVIGGRHRCRSNGGAAGSSGGYDGHRWWGMRTGCRTS